MKKTWLGLAAVAVGLIAAIPAYASVTRYASGNYIWSSVVMTDSNNTVIRTFGNNANQLENPQTTYVANARGYYGGGESAETRRLAKWRAVDLAFQCMWEFFVDGQFDGTQWRDKCLRSDVELASGHSSLLYFQDLMRLRWCSTALAARPAGTFGPVTLSTNVYFFGDAAGTERDYLSNFGYVTTTCYDNN